MSGNEQEENKLVDLICADGLYADAGYPLGQLVDAINGKDNLDFWAHDKTYRQRHQGNLGDATDPFDGRNYTRFDIHANPSTGMLRQPQADKASGVAIKNIRRRASAMVADITVAHWAGVIRDDVHWKGEVIVDGDLTIAEGGRLVVHEDARVRFASTDRLQSGVDLERCELQVEGTLIVLPGRRSYRYNGESVELEVSATARFEALLEGTTWYGIRLDEIADIQVADDLALRDAKFGFAIEQIPFADLDPNLPTAVLGQSSIEQADFQLLPNYPNPFNAGTAIRYVLPRTAKVHIVVYNALGQIMRTLVDEERSAGIEEVVWDGRDHYGQEAASGTYIVRLELAEGHVKTRQMTLVR